MTEAVRPRVKFAPEVFNIDPDVEEENVDNESKILNIERDGDQTENLLSTPDDEPVRTAAKTRPESAENVRQKPKGGSQDAAQEIEHLPGDDEENTTAADNQGDEKHGEGAVVNVSTGPGISCTGRVKFGNSIFYCATERR